MHVTFRKTAVRRYGVYVQRDEAPDLWRQKRMHKYVLPDGRRSEELAGQLERGWHARTLEPRLLRKLDELAERWRSLQPGESLTLEWPRRERRRKHAPRDRRRPARRR